MIKEAWKKTEGQMRRGWRFWLRCWAKGCWVILDVSFKLGWIGIILAAFLASPWWAMLLLLYPSVMLLRNLLDYLGQDCFGELW